MAFESLADKLQNVFKNLRGKGRLSEADVKAALKEDVYKRQGEESKGSLPAESSGYAYPFISPWVLGETLPFLTKIFVFSYGFTEDGDLIEPWKDDTWLIDEAARRGVEPILTLTPMGEEGTFNNFLASRIFRNLDAQQKLIWQLGEVMRSKGYKGVEDVYKRQHVERV